MISPSPRLATFLAALAHAQPNEIVSPPGLGGGWRVRLVKLGLDQGRLIVHWSGTGLCFARFPTSHGACQACAVSKRSICDHCSCAACAFDRLCEDRGGRLVSREKVQELLTRIAALRYSPPAQPGLGLDEELA